MNNEKTTKGGFSRRTFVRNTSLMAASVFAGVLAGDGCTSGPTITQHREYGDIERVVRNGRINQSVCRWCYRKLSLDRLCAAAAGMGLESVELLSPSELPTVKEHGLVCAMVNSHGIKRGMNNKDYHAECVAKLRESIDAAAEYGFPNVISFSGNRAGMPDDVGLENAVTGLKQVIAHAEKKKVNICIEILNSKVNHKDYMFDHMDWGLRLCKRIGSPRLKIRLRDSNGSPPRIGG